MTSNDSRGAMSPHPDALLRLRDIIGDRKATPPIPPIISISAASWWRGVRDGRYPAPAKHQLGPGITAWRARDVFALTEERSAA